MACQEEVGDTLKESMVETESSKAENNYSKENDIFSKIDIANSNKDVDYILEVLKSEDMMHVTRAIKRCTWLITDQQYAHIINPEYLHTQLLPLMTSEACNKLKLHIKLNLNDETRVEGFYNYYYYNDKNPKTAFNWLPKCSSTFIETEVQKNADQIKGPLLKRLTDRLTDASLKNEGNQLSSTKRKCEELKQNWKSTKSSKIQVVLFKKAYDLLCKEKSPEMIEEIWESLSMFFDELSTDESKGLVTILINVSKIPPIVRAKFYMKSFKYLKSLPGKKYNNIVASMTRYSTSLMELLDEEFVTDNIVKDISENNTEIISSFLMCAKDEETQMKRYERCLIPLLERSFASGKGSSSGRNFVVPLLKQLNKDFTKYVLNADMVFPSEMFTDIQKKLEKSFPIDRNYLMLRYWKLTVSLVKILEGHKVLISTLRKNSTIHPEDNCDPESDDTWCELFIKISAEFSAICLQYLKEDVEMYCSSIYLLFADALKDVLNQFNIPRNAIYKGMLVDREFIESYLLVIEQFYVFNLVKNEVRTNRGEICNLIFIDNFDSYTSTEEELCSEDAEICELLRAHPSTEVNLHYRQKLARY